MQTYHPGSGSRTHCEELELACGDELLSINGQEIEDVFDYHYLVNDEYIEVLVRKANGEEWELEVERSTRRIWGSY